MRQLTLLVCLIFCSCNREMTTFEYPTTTLFTVPQYIGCYTDMSTRALSTQLPLSEVTVETCTTAAKLAGYKYAGLQYGTQCFAGNTIGYYKDADTTCNYSCTANYTEWCGGNWHNSIWSTGL